MWLRHFIFIVLLSFLTVACLGYTWNHRLEPRISKVSASGWRIDWRLGK